jgi:hypothetical protein
MCDLLGDDENGTGSEEGEVPVPIFVADGSLDSLTDGKVAAVTSRHVPQ